MARRTATSYRGRTTQTTTTSETTTEAAPAEDKGLGVVEGLVLATTLLLLAAFFLTDYYLGKRFDAGMFFGL